MGMIDDDAGSPSIPPKQRAALDLTHTNNFFSAKKSSMASEKVDSERVPVITVDKV